MRVGREQRADVVQRMVDPELSGILFTADSVSGSCAVTSIDTGFGLSETLVGGLVDADLHKADKATGHVREVRVGDKAFAIRARLEGGTEREALLCLRLQQRREGAHTGWVMVQTRSARRDIT